ncbi:MAG TPA: hypothetical protein VLT33_08840 [Labilithrix sp.]|nr:hypothetical protein [Labilithrix sp.]
MDRTEARACLKLLLAVAHADGELSSDEARVIALHDPDGDTDLSAAAIDIEREAACILSAEAKARTFEAAVTLADIDGRCTPGEHDVLDRIRRALGVTDEPGLARAEREWAERLAAPRAALAQADAAFLKSLARARSEAELSDETYRAMVEELRRKRQEILREALVT